MVLALVTVLRRRPDIGFPHSMEDSYGLVRLYIGPGFAYTMGNAHGGNPMNEEMTMAPKKKATKKLRKAKKIEPTKPLIRFQPIDG
jgi:hypothetical protein